MLVEVAVCAAGPRSREEIRGERMIATKTESKTLIWSLLVVTLVAAWLLLAVRPAHAATFTVNSTSDDLGGACGNPNPLIRCTLREALLEANSTAGADTINFGIPARLQEVKTISPESPLPEITRPLTIDGYTQAGAAENSLAQPGKTNAVLKVELDGTSAGTASGLRIAGTPSTPAPNNVVIRGLAINDFSGNGIVFLPGGPTFVGGTGHRIAGNFIGTNPSGTLAEPNGGGVEFFITDDSALGGASPEDRNLISGNDDYGVNFANASGHRMQGNLVGTTKDGGALGNAGFGVLINDSSSNNAVVGNAIAYSSVAGVWVGSTGSNIGNRILSNSLYRNEGLGINLSGGTENPAGVTANDPDDPDAGPDTLQNYPGISSAVTTPTGSTSSTTIRGGLNSTPKSTFTVQFFSSPGALADPSGFGEGKTFIGQTSVSTNRLGNASFAFVPNQPVPVSWRVTATATGVGGTSEFSRSRIVVRGS
jgi:CSLREA domain-containing protein